MGDLWDAAALENLDVISSYRPTPARVTGSAHISTRTAPIPHSDLPINFEYDPAALQGLQSIAREILAGSYVDGQPSALLRAIADERSKRRYLTPLPVSGEAGLQLNTANQLAAIMTDPMSVTLREWQQVHNTFDLRLRDAEGYLLTAEIKCGHNLADDMVGGAGGAGGQGRIVLSEGFLQAVVDYLAAHGPVVYDTNRHNLKDFPAIIEQNGERVRHAFPDGSDEENMRRVLIQIRNQYASIQITTPNQGNRYILLSTFRQALLFTLKPGSISLSDPLVIDGTCTPTRPIGNVASIFMTLTNLQRHEYNVIIPANEQGWPRRLDAQRERGERHFDAWGNNAGGIQGPIALNNQEQGRPQRGQGQQQQQQRSLRCPSSLGQHSAQAKDTADHSASPSSSTFHNRLDGQPRVVSDSSEGSSANRGTKSMSSHNASTPDTSPTSSLFGIKPRAASHMRAGLRIAFDLPPDIASRHLPGRSAGPPIVQLGVHLSHVFLDQVTDLTGPIHYAEVFRMAGPEGEAWQGVTEGSPSASHDGNEPILPASLCAEREPPDVVVDGYLGIGATSTVFVGSSYLFNAAADPHTSSPSPGRLAVKYMAPDLYPSRVRDGEWDSLAVRSAIVREIRAHELIQLATPSDSTLALKSHGWWKGSSLALGQVWCGIMDGGTAVTDMTMTVQEKQSLLEKYDRLHRLGIVHNDVSLHNLCRTSSGSVVLIDFGLACFGPAARRYTMSLGQNQLVGGAGDVSGLVFEEMAQEEMGRVKAMLFREEEGNAVV